MNDPEVPNVQQEAMRKYFESVGVDVNYEVGRNFEHWFKPTVAYDANSYLFEKLTNNSVNEPDADWRSNGIIGKFDQLEFA